jgi:hypothetical protein
VSVRPAACLAGLAAASVACVIPPLDYSGKPCTQACPEGWSCQGHLCVPDGGRFCDYAPAGAISCLDFEDGLALDGGWQPENASGTWLRVEQGVLVSEPADGGAGVMGRLSYSLPPWSHVRLSFDLNPALTTDTDHVPISEIQCLPDYDGVWFHYAQNSGSPGFVLRAGSGGVPVSSVLVAPQPAFNVWTRITLETAAGSPNTGTLSIDGQSAGTVVFGSCVNPSWVANFGLITSSPLQHAEFDNVVLEVTAP